MTYPISYDDAIGWYNDHHITIWWQSCAHDYHHIVMWWSLYHPIASYFSVSSKRSRNMKHVRIWWWWVEWNGCLTFMFLGFFTRNKNKKIIEHYVNQRGWCYDGRGNYNVLQTHFDPHDSHDHHEQHGPHDCHGYDHHHHHHHHRCDLNLIFYHWWWQWWWPWFWVELLFITAIIFLIIMIIIKIIVIVIVNIVIIIITMMMLMMTMMTMSLVLSWIVV